MQVQVLFPAVFIGAVRALAEGRDDHGRLFDPIRQLVEEGKYVVGQHASERLEERRRMEWQAVVGLLEKPGLFLEDPDSEPNPSIEVTESLPDGTEFKCVWSVLEHAGVAKLVTVHFYDRD